MLVVKGNILARVERAIQEKVFPGCVIGVSRDGLREVLPFGHLTYENGSPKVAAETVYDLASITKSIPTASLAHMFIKEGKLRLADSVKKYLPELLNDHGATIEDLLRYRVEGVRMSTLQFKTFEEIRTYVLESGLNTPPGNGTYTNLPAFILGLILEKVGGASLASIAHKSFFEPLQMQKTTYFPTANDCAPTEIQDDEIIQGVAHDESARVFAKARRSVGHAGLFSTAGDLLQFLGALLENKFPAVTEGAEKGLGWTIAEPWFAGTNVSTRAFGKTGFTGTNVLVDREKRIALVILSNRTYPTRPSDATSLTSAVNIFRRDIADIVFEHSH